MNTAEENIILTKDQHIYQMNYDNVTEFDIRGDLNNKLFCTFTDLDSLDSLIENITSQYNILYNKMFVLEVKDTDEYVVTYNVDQGNVNSIPENTILVHRKKESNTLYTINALNQLIMSLNGGYKDPRYRVNWRDYQNSILLTQHGEYKKLNTKIYQIINL